MKALLLYIFISVLQCVTAINIVNCEATGETFLQENSFSIFQSPDYPSIMKYYRPSFLECYHKFTTNGSSVWITLLNGNLQNFDLTGVSSSDQEDYVTQKFIWDKMPSWFSYFTTYPALEFAAKDYYGASQQWRGFQAFVYAPSTQDSFTCPLSDKKFYIANNIDFYPISSSFWYLQDVIESNVSCKWEFSVQLGYTTKLHIKQLNLAANESLIVFADGRTEHIIFSGLYFFDGSNITIIYQRNAHSSEKYGFGGLVTGYLKTNKTNSCDPLNTYSFSKGYPNNAFCEKSFTIQPNHVLSVNYFGYLEDKVDTLFANDGIGNGIFFQEKGDWIFDEKAKDVTFSFESDGNLIAAGYEITLKNNTCACSNETITPICHLSFSYFDTYYLPVYCSSMKCSLTILPNSTCATQQLLVIPKISLRPHTKDTIKLYSNGKLMSNFNSSNPTQSYLILNPNSTIRVDYETDDSLFGTIRAPFANIAVTNLSPNLKKTTVPLTPDNFTFTLNLYRIKDQQQLVTVTAPKGYTLDFFLVENLENSIPRLSPKDYLLIDEENNNVVDVYDLPRHKTYGQMRYYTAKGTTLQFLANDDILATAFFRIREIHTKNCQNENNIAVISNFTITVTSTSEGPCYFTLLKWPNYVSKTTEYMNLKTNASENVKFVVGTDPSLTFFEFNSQTASNWSHLFLYGLANSFFVPANSSVTFKNLNYQDNYGYDEYSVAKGIFTSTTFADLSEPISQYDGVRIKEGNKCRVTVKYLDFSSNATLGISLGSWKPPQLITQVNQTLEFLASDYPKEPKIYIQLNETQKGYRGYVLEFEMMAAPSKASSIFVPTLFFVLYYLL